jgi:hypothetical protein
MDEILKKLLESDLLSEETKTQITEQFKTAVDAYLAEERSKLEVEIHSQLTEEFVQAREALAARVDAKIDEVLNEEFAELKDDINKFRDLEVEYAEKLVEEKEQLASTLGEQLNQLVDKIDAFLEVRIDEEIAELKEDIDQVKKLEFGRRIFEAVEAEFKSFRKEDMGDVERELAETADKLADAEAKIYAIENERLAETRNAKLEELLKPLTGNAKEQMKIILSNVATEKLNEAYTTYIGRVLKETVVDSKKDETPPAKVIAEGEPKAVITEAKVVTGNEDTSPEDNVAPVVPDQLRRIRQLAGLK